jgi:hypothetical protein
MREAVGPQEWYQAFRRVVRDNRWADPLREAALAGHLGVWTEHLTGAVVAACATFSWTAVARGHLAEVLPVPKQEYLVIDVMAFETADKPGWRRPIAAFELENRPELEAVSYSVWKVSVVRCGLSGVFCYRKQPEEIGDLITSLTHGVMAAIDQPGEKDSGKLLLVVGTRSEAEGFPDGFFKPYAWDRSTKRFQVLWLSKEGGKSWQP